MLTTFFQFAAGKLAEYNFNLPLSLDETLILADAARLVERFDVNIEFLSLAVKKTGSSDLKAEIERTLADSIDDVINRGRILNLILCQIKFFLFLRRLTGSDIELGVN